LTFQTDPFVRPEPSVLPRPPSPASKAEALDFYRTRDQCLQERRLFEDPEFPACDSSLFFSKRPPKLIEWRRPGEIIDDPQLIFEGQSRFDVVQGELGDCWLLAAAANLTLRDELFYRVVPPDQSFTENYAGIFHFQFWQYGRWVDVVIDDRLPTSGGELLYMHSRDHNEFWSALLEKAYAKLHGSYEALKGGTTSEALEDMTGGLTEFFDLHNPPDHLMEMMMRGFEMGSLFGCSIEADPYEWEARMSNGLVRGHAYSITGMRMVNGPRGRTPILRIRNPWGNEQEWNGAWSDNSREWQYISEQEKRDMGLVFSHDGEFWFPFADPYEWEARMSNGLVRGHAYSITGMRMVNGPRGRTPILRIRNPWGNEQEWNGAWSDNSREWQYISEQEKRDMGLVFSHDGDVMSFDDFMRYFEKMEICNLGPDVMDEISQMTGVHSSQTTWATNIHEGSWISWRMQELYCKLHTFADNPQYRIHLTDSDPDDDDELCTVIIAVMQKYRRELKHAGVENLAIGFAVYD
uniref:Calpain catalytic domain-containing protein n=1 Tax=Ascaris lumbricoides TaxID=6252 RepID=A0A0M3IPF5_ASCLU